VKFQKEIYPWVSDEMSWYLCERGLFVLVLFMFQVYSLLKSGVSVVGRVCELHLWGISEAAQEMVTETLV